MSAVLFQFGLSNVVFSLERLGFFQLLFPFLLSLAIVYGVLSWTAKERLGKAPIALISIVISFFVMLYAATNSFIVTFLTQFSGVALIAGTGILMILILLGLVGVKFHGKKEEGNIYEALKGNWVMGAVILIVLYIVITAIFGSSGFFPPGFLINNDFWTVVFFIIVLVVAVKFLGGEEKEEKKTAAPAGRPG